MDWTVYRQLRDSGAKVQRSLAEEPLMIKRPWSGWLFPPLLLMGLVTAVFAAVMSFSPPTTSTTTSRTPATIFGAIVLALATIVKAIRFRGDRVGADGRR